MKLHTVKLPTEVYRRLLQMKREWRYKSVSAYVEHELRKIYKLPIPKRLAR